VLLHQLSGFLFAEASCELSLLLQLLLLEEGLLLLVELIQVFLFLQLGLALHVKHLPLLLSDCLKSGLSGCLKGLKPLGSLLFCLPCCLTQLLVAGLLLVFEVLHEQRLVLEESLQGLYGGTPDEMLSLLEGCHQGRLLVEPQALKVILKVLFLLVVLDLDVHLALALFLR